MTKREAATVVAALFYYMQDSVKVVTSVRVPEPLNRESPLSDGEALDLALRLVKADYES